VAGSTSRADHGHTRDGGIERAWTPWTGRPFAEPVLLLTTEHCRLRGGEPDVKAAGRGPLARASCPARPRTAPALAFEFRQCRRETFYIEKSKGRRAISPQQHEYFCRSLEDFRVWSFARKSEDYSQIQQLPRTRCQHEHNSPPYDLDDDHRPIECHERQHSAGIGHRVFEDQVAGKCDVSQHRTAEQRDGDSVVEGNYTWIFLYERDGLGLISHEQSGARTTMSSGTALW
jgi:hypothetical protein